MRGLDSASELSRFKSRFGYRITRASPASAYITTAKLKRVVDREFTALEFAIAKKQYSVKTVITRDKLADTMIQKLNYMSAALVGYAWDCYDNLGIRELWRILLTKKKELKKIESKLKQNDCNF